jgi:hypothetical protein
MRNSGGGTKTPVQSGIFIRYPNYSRWYLEIQIKKPNSVIPSVIIFLLRVPPSSNFEIGGQNSNRRGNLDFIVLYPGTWTSASEPSGYVGGELTAPILQLILTTLPIYYNVSFSAASVTANDAGAGAGAAAPSAAPTGADQNTLPRLMCFEYPAVSPCAAQCQGS